MSYNRTTAGGGPLTLGWGGAPINLADGDFAVPDTAKAVVVTADGDVVCRPVNATADIIISGVPAGFLLPWHCAAIRQAGTTASLATVEG